MINDHLNKDELIAYTQYKLDYNEFFILTKEQFSRYDKHVKECQNCQKEFEDLKSEFLIITKNKTKNLFSYRNLLIAASILIISTISFFVFISSSEPKTQNLALYKKNNELEYLLNNSLRKDMIEVISPKNHQNFKREIYFKLNGIDTNKTITLKIMNNQEIIVYEQQIIKSSFTLKIDFQAAYYYWSLEDNDDIFYYGSFYFED